jgi:hypothetical protein
LVRIPACHAGGRGFESRPLRQISVIPEMLEKEHFNEKRRTRVRLFF